MYNSLENNIANLAAEAKQKKEKRKNTIKRALSMFIIMLGVWLILNGFCYHNLFITFLSLVAGLTLISVSIWYYNNKISED